MSKKISYHLLGDVTFVNFFCKDFVRNFQDPKKNRENIFCQKLNKGMETVRKFIEEAVKEYNSGRLTVQKLYDMSGNTRKHSRSRTLLD